MSDLESFELSEEDLDRILFGVAVTRRVLQLGLEDGVSYDDDDQVRITQAAEEVLRVWEQASDRIPSLDEFLELEGALAGEEEGERDE